VDHTPRRCRGDHHQTRPAACSGIGEIYGNRIFIVPYVMPGFVLAARVYEMTRDIDWAEGREGVIP
jgi:rhamnose utilization protein RhaD (predicted bifunctional aldolase and dehydrogenase)